MLTTKQGLVVRSTAGFVDVRVDDQIIQCRLRGRLKKDLRSTDICVIGDQVIIESGEDGVNAVSEVLPRRSRFSRRQPGKGPPKEDVVIANLDQLLITFSYGQPVFNPRLLDRFLVIAEHQRVEPCIVMNKADLAAPDDTEWAPAYEALGYRILEVSTRNGRGVEELRTTLADRISAFVGPSGVGKTSLLNILAPGLELNVAEVSHHHGKGRHTTRVASLFPIDDNGFVADTPGIRELGTWALPKDELDSCFPDFSSFRTDCNFRRCSHVHEPECAVIDAVDRGAISTARYESYRRLREEATR